MAKVVGAEHQLVAVLGLSTRRLVERDTCVVDHHVEMIEAQPVHGGLQGRQVGEVQLKGRTCAPKTRERIEAMAASVFAASLLPSTTTAPVAASSSAAK